MPTPLREPSYFILAALIDDPLHGYAILKRVEELSQGQVRLSTGTLYGALERLSREGLLSAGTEEIVEGRPRRAYSLTSAGLAAITAESQRLRAAALVVSSRVPRVQGGLA